MINVPHRIWDKASELGYIGTNEAEEIQTWIRQVHQLHPVIIPTINFYWTFKIIDIQCNPYDRIERPPYKGVHDIDYQTYEECLEEALLECLNMLK